jgi:3-phosphoshikimate 1-carboxyvinyltransferase
MSAFGAQAEIEADVIKVSNQKRYRGCAFEIEPDATAASYFLGAAAIAGGSVTIEGLGKWSAQGDLRFVQCLERMGCSVEWRDRQIALRGPALRGIDVDMNEFSDTVQTLAVVALFVDGPTTIRNVAHIRHKESDRIADLARELRKLGGRISETVDGLRITPDKLRGAELDTYDDHRMAMSWALAGLRIPGVVIRDPECVGKTYPNFFRDLARVTQAGVESI